MWPRQSHKLAPLTRLLFIQRKLKWTQVKQYALEKNTPIVDCDTLITYTDFNETFKIHNNASVFQLGAVISQKVKSIAFYSIKLTDT